MGTRAVIDLGCDTLVIGEMTYHDHVTCALNGVRVIRLGHKESEVVVLPVIQSFLQKSF